ncbi:hypothetical protein [Spirochaeta lutea]|uniref:Lipoprotein n=1 Tax=Spirochaeta lutea TaxID=1480694 RepID=A0A098R1U3_9SPIO|nr:hypothetical protein [Spirochaeta lutea]KGE73741.1 hypothetical protein DC28_00450 [Spirochaeta lutea]
MKRVLLALAMGLMIMMLGGCIEIEMNTKINPQNGGTFTISYTMQKDFYEMGALEQDDSAEALPLDEAEFRDAVDKTGLHFRSFEQIDDGNAITILAAFDFDSVEALNQYYEEQSEFAKGIRVEKNGDTTTYTQPLLPAATGEDAPSPEDLEIMKTFFEGFELRYVLEAPAAIQRANIGTVDGNVIALSIGFEEMVSLQEDLVWEISWSQ